MGHKVIQRQNATLPPESYTLRHTVTPSGLLINPDYTAIKNILIPKRRKYLLKGFLGPTGYLQNWIPNYLLIPQLLHKKPRQDQPYN